MCWLCRVGTFSLLHMGSSNGLVSTYISKKGEVATVNDSVYGLVDIRERKDYGEISGRIVMIGLHGRRAKWLPLPRCAKLF